MEGDGAVRLESTGDAFMRGVGAAGEGSAPAWAMEAAGGGRVARVNRGPDHMFRLVSAGVSLIAYPISSGGVPSGYTEWDTHTL